ncbi:GNAT family N-acetyltransferase [Sphaerisporangium aureirubrum]|uniref:GNAT family N-acetyltransferase n=1 Tax=Sphaerisporangium aureirubrum TaxID=1544736 RepID=A0ABW1NLW9_9ACTN
MEDWPAGDLVRLRLPRVDDQPVIDEWSMPQARSRWNAGVRRPRTVAQRLESGPLVSGDGGILLIVRLADERPVGDIVWKPVYYGQKDDTRSRAWRVGRELLPAARGQGYGTEAMRLLIGWLFATTDANRVDGYTDCGNEASRRSVAKAGMRHEGILRGALYRDGEYRDLAMYAVTRADWAEPAASGQAAAGGTA